MTCKSRASRLNSTAFFTVQSMANSTISGNEWRLKNTYFDNTIQIYEFKAIKYSIYSCIKIHNVFIRKEIIKK